MGRAARALAGRVRRLIACGLAVAVAAGLAMVAPIGSAAVAAEDPQADPRWREQRIAAWPQLADTPPVAGREEPRPTPTRPGLASAKPQTVAWPAPGAAMLDLSPAQGPARAATVAPGGLPVRIAPAGQSPAGGSRVRVEVLDRAAARAAGVDGVLLRLRAQQAGSGPIRVAVNYARFAHAYGGDWSTRLRLVRLPTCAVTSPDRPGCRTWTPVESVNNTAAGTVTATVALTDDALVGSASRGELATGEGVAPAGGGLFALLAGSSGPAGDWSATPLSASGIWQVSAQTGDFGFTYPLRVAPGVGGPTPQLSLSYSSGSVDGRVASTNNQTSWIGDGWELWPGYVERKYASCADDATGAAKGVSGDLCN
jgi:hypothetical protein